MKTQELQNKTIELLNPWWKNSKIELGITRTKYLNNIDNVVKNRQQILFILGSRRVGKTRIILQYIDSLINSDVSPKKILFLSLDNSNLKDFNWYDYICESNFEYIFLDEVHHSPNWAQILKSLYDIPNKKIKIICSGSSSKLIEDNKAFLTGRSTNLHVVPLDFVEFSNFSKNEDLINDYLFYGGYPEFVLEREPNYLNELVKDIVEKDIVKIHKIRNSQHIFDLCQILAKQVGSKGSSNKIANVLGLDNKTVENYIQYLREVKLIDTVYQYSDSLNKQLYAPKKYYFNDLGVRNSFVGFSDIGSLVENAVYLHLSKLYGQQNIFYLSDLKINDVDFVVKLKEDKLIFVESKYNDLQSSVTNSLSKIFFKDIYGKKIIERLAITNKVDEIVNMNGAEINLVSLEEFLLKQK